MAEILRCNAASGAYDITIGKGVWEKFASFPGRKLLVRDGNVPNPGIEADGEIVLTPGEQYKTFAAVESICRRAAQLHLTRKDLFIALGGGVTGDLTGFASAIYMRGVRFIQIPTTLLAMVDASVGGKTAADLPEGKNLIGAFHQPEAVLIDPGFLKTLSFTDLTGGMAEVVKTAVILDRQLFDRLEAAGESSVLAPDFDSFYVELIKRCCQLKAQVVESDEKENGLRAILNYGHTFGHAVEQKSLFSIPHGAAVAIGMNAAGILAAELGMWSSSEAERQLELLKKLRLPVTVPAEFAPAELLEIMRSDKKNDSSGIRLVLPEKIGSAKTVSGIPEKMMLKAWELCHD
ncbi:MAG: 3-dehydroquinate synthase [Lentisphaeria bacterium]|nr:3-dehydroquinate synthase [Lentisphaeria bacterium]